LGDLIGAGLAFREYKGLLGKGFWLEGRFWGLIPFPLEGLAILVRSFNKGCCRIYDQFIRLLRGVGRFPPNGWGWFTWDRIGQLERPPIRN